ncbi:hypothetical protein I9018_24405 [Pseudomonas sp. MPFS]|uniref:hypothetical protein n=1 Tax=Pseudomonas sp. MPFS TaxID=2795724 RepID=UPI001F13CE52|nr:hypothetical protein [Pseudomonas sp. MPFS]UMZ10605.1 hypothetical protein I9018_24405 [Pseudomonas sp. MPFS]
MNIAASTFRTVHQAQHCTSYISQDFGHLHRGAHCRRSYDGRRRLAEELHPQAAQVSDRRRVFAYTRNTIYLGEILVYATYATLAEQWVGWVLVLHCWLGLTLPRMLAKDTSISRHPSWTEYKVRSGLLLSWRILLAPFTAPNEEHRAC